MNEVTLFISILRHASFLALLLGVLVAGPVQASICPNAVPLDSGEIWRDVGGVGGDAACFVIETDRSGILVLDLSAASTAARMRLRVLTDDTASAPSLLLEAATFIALEARPGRYFAQVAAEDPQAVLASFRLRARFVVGEGATKSELDSEIEVEPDPLLADLPRRCAAKGELDSEIEVEPDPFRVGPSFQVAPGLHDLSVLPEPLCRPALCRRDGMDDHADGFACATSLISGQVIHGELDNGWGDDVDVFRVDLGALSTVEVAASAEIGLVLGLYDRFGHRLGTAIGEAGGPSQIRMLRTLAPGRYFVAVEGRAQATGAYALRVTGPGR